MSEVSLYSKECSCAWRATTEKTSLIKSEVECFEVEG